MNGADRARRAVLAALARSRIGSRIELELAIDLCGRRVVIPVVGGLGPRHSDVTEAHLLPAIAAGLALRPGAFVDGGAHTGETLLKLLVLDPERRYVGFEPQLRGADYVRRLLAANRAEGNVVAAALGDRDGPAELRRASELDEGATVVESFRGPDDRRRPALVPMLRGDEALATLGVERVAILKLDLEGGELEAVRGFAETIARDQPVLLCEILPIGAGNGELERFRRGRAEELIGLLREHGYGAHPIDARGRVGDGVAPRQREPGARDLVFVGVDEGERFIARASAARVELLAAVRGRSPHGAGRLRDRDD